jgi:hypothetical protein
MIKKRLITFGCSYPFGQGLPDCIGRNNNEPGKTASHQAFPALIANAIDRENINLSVPGSSNKAMVYRLQKFKFEISDIVLLNWTHAERSCVINNNTASIIGPWCPDKKSKIFYKQFSTNEEIEFNNKIFISWTNYYLAQCVTQIINTKPFNYTGNTASNFKSNNVEFLDNTINDYRTDHAADGSHPGIKSHQAYADYILTVLERN